MRWGIHARLPKGHIPGYFAADGDAANSSATRGDKWRARLSPDEIGRWSYKVSFRKGKGVAVDDAPSAGRPVAGCDGVSGFFDVDKSDATGRDFRRRGRLRYVGEHYLRFADGSYFLKTGVDSPENFLAYDDFDNTPDHGNRRKNWQPHVRDWRAGDPAWSHGKGRGIIGAINYLATNGLNAFSFLTYSHHGDDGNMFPHADPESRLRMDCSKLDRLPRIAALETRVTVARPTVGYHQ
jgi:hypothetical protein